MHPNSCLSRQSFGRNILPILTHFEFMLRSFNPPASSSAQSIATCSQREEQGW